jgi:hypothetical protein
MRGWRSAPHSKRARPRWTIRARCLENTDAARAWVDAIGAAGQRRQSTFARTATFW